MKANKRTSGEAGGLAEDGIATEPMPNANNSTMQTETINDNNAGDSRLNDFVDKDTLLSETVTLDKCTMPFVVTKSGSELSTITVNNRTLPLNTSDDLERAASLLMHQTLDLEDDFEFVNIKSESLDPIAAVDNDDSSARSLAAYNLATDFSNIHYSHTDFLYSYYPQATQCDFAMMPLPPINTVKRKLKGINSSSSIFPGMTNVL